MLTICLDESGNFEDSQYTRPLIVAGVVYTGDDPKLEENRLVKFYEGACIEIENELSKSLGRVITVEYPRGLHSTENNQGYKNKSENVKTRINKLLNKKIIDYIKKSGKYHITAMIKNREMEETINKPIYNEEYRVNTLVDFNNGANLYERMATRFLYNNIFYNPLLMCKNSKVDLKLATRTIEVEKDTEKYNQLQNLGYNSNENGDGSYRFYISQASTFKSALSTKIYDGDVNKNIEYNLSVESINYSTRGSSPYLYLADNICDIVKTEIRELKGELNIIDLIKVLNKKTGSETFCFIHDDVDLIWSRLVENLIQNNLIGVLEKIGEIKNSDSRHKNLYCEYWIPQVEKELDKLFNEKMIDIYLGSLEYYFSKDSSEYEKGMEIAKWLIRIIDNKNIRSKEYIKYKISEKIALAYNHRGAIDNALKYFNICEELKGSGIAVTDYLEMVNRKTVALSNACSYDKAKEELSRLLYQYEKIQDAYLEIAITCDMDSEKSYEIEAKGKVLSAIGQNLAFLGEYYDAEKAFLSAIETFRDNRNKSVTRSYLLHMFIESKNREKYEEYIVEMLNTTDIFEQFKGIVSSNQIDRYNLFLYLKALNNLYIDKFDGEFALQIFNVVDKFMNDIEFNQHPKELIIKHLAQILFKKNEKVKADRLMNKYIASIDQSEFTIRAIVQKAWIDYYELKKSSFHVNNHIERANMDKKMVAHIDSMKDEIRKQEKTKEVFDMLIKTPTNEIMKCRKLIDEKITYMYN